MHRFSALTSTSPTIQLARLIPKNFTLPRCITSPLPSTLLPPPIPTNTNHPPTATCMGFLYYGRPSRGRVSGIRKIAPSRSTKPEHLRPDLNPVKTRKRRRLDAPTKPNKRITRHPFTLSGLPTELLHDIFLGALNPALAASSLGLARILAAGHLHHRYVRALRAEKDELERVLKFRFFTAEFLTAHEARFNQKLDFTGVPIPSQLSSLAAGENDEFSLLKMLVERGGDCGAEDGENADAHSENVRDALAMGREGAVGVLCKVKGFRVDSEMLKMAVKGDMGVDFCRNLIDCGAATSVDVWRSVLSGGDGRYIQMLMDLGTPPGEVLGELSQEWV